MVNQAFKLKDEKKSGSILYLNNLIHLTFSLIFLMVIWLQDVAILILFDFLDIRVFFILSLHIFLTLTQLTAVLIQVLEMSVFLLFLLLVKFLLALPVTFS